MKKEYKPYCYLIGWSKYNKWYYGSEYGSKTKIANPDNLWVTYFTSSKEIARMRVQYGEPDIIEVRKVFNDRASTTLWEHKVLKRLNATQADKWVNKTDNKAIVNSIETQKIIASKISAKLKGRTKSKEHIEKIKNTKRNNPRVFTDEEKKAIGIRSSNISKETRAKKSKTMSSLIWVNDGKQSFRVKEEYSYLYNQGRLYTPKHANNDVLTYTHKEGYIFTGTRYQLKKAYPHHNINLSELGLMIRGKYQNHRGWSTTI